MNKSIKKASMRVLLLIIAVVVLAGSIFLISMKSRVYIPILMYHHLNNEGDGDVIIKTALFAEHMEALANNGYNTVSFAELQAYVDGSGSLPENPVIITFDDGYLSNYETAFPILKQHGLKATVFVIGTMVGATTYKDTGIWTYPCFTYEQARKMYESGVFDIQSHTFDMHQWPPNETGDYIRDSVLKLDNESEQEHRAALESDFSLSKSLIEEGVGNRVFVLSYPHGDYTTVSEEISAELGFTITVTTKHGTNRIKIGDENCLRTLNRYTITDNISADDLIKLLSRF